MFCGSSQVVNCLLPSDYKKKYSARFRNIFRLFPVVVLLVWYFGYSDAESNIAKSDKTRYLVLKGVNQRASSVIPLRSFDKAILVWHEKTKTYEFVPWHNIHRLSSQPEE